MAVTVSIGVTASTGGELAAVIGRADRALYAAKAAGRNTVRRDDPAQVTALRPLAAE